MAPVDLEIRSVSLAGLPARTRLPFRFGKVTLVEAPVLAVRVVARVEGQEVVGYSADLAVPKWFSKRDEMTPAQDMAALMDSVRRACVRARGQRGSAFSIWQGLDQGCTGPGQGCGIPLVDVFGVALVERALIDAACRAGNESFAEALVSGGLGFESGGVIPETAALRTEDLIVAPGAERVHLRHTVGGLDALRKAEVTAEQRGSDSHPVALEEDIARYGLGAFKLKIGSGLESDLARLCEIARVVEECGVEQPVFSLDGNEQISDLGMLSELLDRLEADPDGRRLLEGLRYIEQPLAREKTFDPSTEADIRGLGARFPLLIDEADHSADAFSHALALGYQGVSVKNCKGVFRAIANRALCLVRGGGTFQTSEDLTNLPVLSLQQDLTTLAALGLDYSERNGHHYFPGLDVIPAAEAESALETQPDLYERQGDRVVLKIRDGSLSLACRKAKGYGYASEIDWESRLSFRDLEAGLRGL